MDIEDVKGSTKTLKSLQTFDNIDIDPYSLYTMINTQRDSIHENELVKTRKSDSATHKKQSQSINKLQSPYNSKSMKNKFSTIKGSKNDKSVK